MSGYAGFTRAATEMLWSFPKLRDRNEALSTIDLVVHDERLRELDNWFTDERKKALLISQASEAYPELSGGAVALSSDDTPQLGQVRTLISRWNRARPARFPRAIIGEFSSSGRTMGLPAWIGA